CQVRIDAPRRPYTDRERDGLSVLFGPAAPGTLRSLLWTHATVMVPAFVGETHAALHLPCTVDLAIAATRYFLALEQGVVPLTLLFSGTIFHERPEGGLQIARVPWSGEARFDLPVRVYTETLEHHHPNRAGVFLDTAVFERLVRFRDRFALPTLDDAVTRLL